MAYTLSRSSSGLLAINAWNSDSLPGSAIPFVTADWTYSTGVTPGLGVNKQLNLTNSNAALWYAAQRTAIASRSKTFFYALVRTDSGGAGFGSAAHITQVSTPTCVEGGISIARAGGDLARITTTVAGTASSLASTSVATKLVNTVYKATFIADGTAVSTRDLTAAVTVSGTYTASSGRVGLLWNGGADTEILRWIAMADRFVTVSGIPTGGSAEILTPAAAVLASASESGGTATVDLFAADVANAQSIRVKDGGGTVLDTYQDISGGSSNNLIAGGDAFALSLSGGPFPFYTSRALAGGMNFSRGGVI